MAAFITYGSVESPAPGIIMPGKTPGDDFAGAAAVLFVGFIFVGPIVAGESVSVEWSAAGSISAVCCGAPVRRLGWKPLT